jgi:nucleoside-diphosphate-sugar epimerase
MSMQLRMPLRGKVMITGASGFIGGHLRDALLDGGADVVCLVRASSLVGPKGRSIAVDYSDQDALTQVMASERPDYVFHVAGSTKGVTYEDFRRGNVMPTQHLLEALLRGHPEVKRFLHVSSLTAYGPSNDGPPKRETDPRLPLEFYGRSKLEAEQSVESYGERLAWTIVRPSAVYGPAEVDLFTLFRAAKLGINLFYGNRDKRTSAIYVDDLVDAMVTAAQVERTRSRGYLLCDGVPYTWGEIQGHIAAAVGRRALTLRLPSFFVPAAGIAGELLTAIDKKPRLLNRQKAVLDAQSAWLCTHEAARADFDYRPRVDMAEGTRRAYAWYVAHGWL